VPHILAHPLEQPVSVPAYGLAMAAGLLRATA
jgi:hypothetical protein